MGKVGMNDTEIILIISILSSLMSLVCSILLVRSLNQQGIKPKFSITFIYDLFTYGQEDDATLENDDFRDTT